MRKRILVVPCLLLCHYIYAQNKDSVAAQLTEDSVAVLAEVTVAGKKPFIQLFPDKTVVNVESAVTNTGASLLEVLEKSPGITIDRNGGISLKGRQGVLIMIDGKPAQVSGNDLNNLLSGMTASQVDQIEIMDNPSAKYDAAGNAGIINIKTKKNNRKGFNGNVNLALGQGKFSRTVNSLNINRYSGKVNVFANVNVNLNRNFMRMYALRKYYAEDNTTLLSILDQPSYLTGKAPSQSIKTGVDYYITKKTTLGTVVNFTNFTRRTVGSNVAVWLDQEGKKDSSIVTHNNLRDELKSYAVNLNGKHVFNQNAELTADFDYLGYRIKNQLFFNNVLEGPSGYNDDMFGDIPSTINILTGKADYSETFAKDLKLETGWKSSHIKTNNKAEYFLRTGGTVTPDYGKTNHFLYEENIHAAYASLEKKFEKFTLQGGLRYENTHYNAEQLGNEVRKDSSFSRKYDGVFPNAVISWQVDSLNALTLSAGRRIDRPRFQSLNPFVFVINKYTYQSGNPFFIPQYTWNTELSHSFKNILVTSLSFSYTKDYFSQIFYQDSSGIITYTEGNLDNMKNIGLSVSAQVAPFHWWSLSFEGVVNHKMIKGFVWNTRKASLTQGNININNQFVFPKGWSGELSAFFITNEQELQEVTYPTGQLSFGVGKQIFKNRGTIKFTARDILYTQKMEGFTNFSQSTEYFIIKRDTRAASISFTYRFGKEYKSQPRNTGGAEDEMRRVNTTG
ncbi:MAG: TonB-dependent receptor [Chitinophagaceae bacterium]|nr:TonB-dependent receptor [Chitinophagaceae bacterium]